GKNQIFARDPTGPQVHKGHVALPKAARGKAGQQETFTNYHTRGDNSALRPTLPPV
ncbi:hypothetical protein KI387_018879, partial [Taxus chinensis]